MVVVNWNGGTMLDDCLASVFAQTWSAFELVLVDNGSKDGSLERAVATWGERLRVVRNERNEGFARANNQAFAIARGEWVFLLNNDAVLQPDALAELMRFVEGKPQAGMLACRVVRYDLPNYFDSVGLLFYPDGTCRPRGWEEKDLGQYDRPDEVIAPHGCAAAFRRVVLEETGGFDEVFFAYLEDLDLGMRAQMLGWTCWYVPTAVARHRKSMTAGNYSKFKAYHVERNRIFIAIKLLPRFLLFMSPLFALNRYLMQGYAAYTHRGISGEFVREYSYTRLVWILIHARLSAWWHLPSMLRKRLHLRRTRKVTTAEWYRMISRFKLDAIELALKY